jgi:predicted O-methyltransferase YrrM
MSALSSSDPTTENLRYDAHENYTDDVELLRRLIGDTGPLKILECFSGTGRILVPLAEDGHRITGIEIATSMAARASEKLERLGSDVMDRVTLKVGDVLDGGWGTGYDLVIIGANAYNELPSAAASAHCIEMAFDALIPGGHLSIDNDDYKGKWGAGPFGRE